MAQGAQDLPQLSGLLTLLDFGNPLLAGPDRLTEFCLRELAVLARGRKDLANLGGGLCPHTGVLVIRRGSII